MNGTAIKISGAVVVITAIGLGVFSYVSPSMLAGQIEKAAANADRERLERLIDFPKVRESLKGELGTYMNQRAIASAETETQTLFAPLIAGLAKGLVDPIIDEMVSPANVEKAVRGEELKIDSFGGSDPAAVVFPKRKPGEKIKAAGRYLSLSNYRFKLRSAGDEGSLDIDLARRGPFSWRVVRLTPHFPSEPRPLAASGSTPNTIAPPTTADAEARYTPNYQSCMNTGDAADGVTVAMLNCAAEEIEVQDRALNAAYQRALASLWGADRENLRAAQRTWLARRDADCTAAGQSGGSMDGLNISGCFLESTVRRTIELERQAPTTHTAASSSQAEMAGSTLLYREAVERYWNDWTGQKIQSPNSPNQVDIQIAGEGKTAAFSGVLSINCETGGGQFWRSAGNFEQSVLEDGELSDPDIMPTQVIAKAREVYCR